MPFFFPIIVVVVIALIIFGAINSSKRRQALAAWATAHGLQFDSGSDSSLDGDYPGFDCLHQGHSRSGSNWLRGRWKNRDFLGFDYRYVTGSGKERQSHSFSAVIITSPFALKQLLIRPENFLDKITEFVGFDDIDFESAEFSRRFFVKAPDRKWAYDVIHARAMEYLLGQPPFAMQFDQRSVIVWMGGKVFAPEDFAAAADAVTGLLDMLPEYVVLQQRENASQS